MVDWRRFDINLLVYDVAPRIRREILLESCLLSIVLENDVTIM